MQEVRTTNFGEFEVVWKRRTGVRHIKVTMESSQKLRLVTPWQASWRLVEKFLLEHQTWLASKRESTMREEAQLSVKFPTPTGIAGETIYVFGEQRKLRLVLTLLKKPFWSLGTEYLNYHIPEKKMATQRPSPEFLLNQMKKFLKKQAQEFFENRAQMWAEEMQLSFKKLSLRSQKSRWGSCNSKHHISLNWRLVSAPLEVIDSVIVHELAHVKYLNHSSHFWSLVERHCPKYEDANRWLIENARALDWLHD